MVLLSISLVTDKDVCWPFTYFLLCETFIDVFYMWLLRNRNELILKICHEGLSHLGNMPLQYNFLCFYVGFYHAAVHNSANQSSPLERPFPLPPHPFGSSQSTRLASLCYPATCNQLSVSHTVVYICQCYLLNSSDTVLPLLCPIICSLCLHLHSSPENMFISTGFLDSVIYALMNNICFSLSSLCIRGSRFIHLTAPHSVQHNPVGRIFLVYFFTY